MQPVHCLTFDIEEHFHVSAFDSPMRRNNWDRFESRVERNTHKILELLAARDTRATFFVLGWVAERHPGLIRSIAQAGHEVASHGYAHELITAQTPRTFREDVRWAKQILEDLIGDPVLGYRAPSSPLNGEMTWATPILVEEGFTYHSSIAPVLSLGGRCRVTEKSVSYYQLETGAGPLWEIPQMIVRVAGIKLSYAEVSCLRILPHTMLRQKVERMEAKGRSLTVGVRSWEFDPDQPRMRGPAMARFWQYVNLDKVETRLESLLRDFRFSTIHEALETANGEPHSRDERVPAEHAS